MLISDHKEWAELIFSRAQLGDPRRTNRLVKLAGDMASSAGKAVCQASEDPASIEGAYRFIRNDAISTDDIALAGYQYTDDIVRQRPLVLALQDTTGLSYRHSVCDELGDVNSSNEKRNSNKGRTLYAHSTLMFDAHNEQPIGLAYQHYWHRETTNTSKGHKLQLRDREEKESYKWQNNVEEIAERLVSMDNVIDVCDREADIFEYLDYQISNGHRFVVRSDSNRRLSDTQDKLHDVINSLEPSTYYSVHIKQRGGRKARTAKIALSYSQINIKKPQRAKAAEALKLNVIVCQEVDSGNDEVKEKLRWILYTSESLNGPEDAKKIVRYYELRWRIEEFHKIWKSEGTQVEKLRMQTRENLRRVAVIQAFIAVRLFQLREVAQNKEEAKTIPCDVYLSQVSWKILWKTTNKIEPIPDEIPSLHWAYYALAKLGRWHDSKRNGRVGIKALWDGWRKLADLVESYHNLRGLDF